MIVVAKRVLSNGKIRAITTKSSCVMPFDCGKYALRFIKKDSFKAANSNFVVENFEIQLMMSGIDDYIKADENVSSVKVQKVIDSDKEKSYLNKIKKLESEITKLREKKESKQIVFKIEEDKEELF